ncbi:MAG: hypothetical protein AAF387_22410, partial [Pseudomonadota bacterium]
TYYRKAPSIPDAHYNLARLFEVRGNELAALRHMREYRRLLERELQDRERAGWRNKDCHGGFYAYSYCLIQR